MLCPKSPGQQGPLQFTLSRFVGLFICRAPVVTELWFSVLTLSPSGLSSILTKTKDFVKAVENYLCMRFQLCSKLQKCNSFQMNTGLNIVVCFYSPWLLGSCP